ncbi:MAG: 23S rRNA (pseudouridine(1915)-N(3))-methyltransferase RlmH [Clostridiales Family XIII bacterium]|jgi:23S rRNA (pseudouridine1915-N3)-methyltransferase|nr:23S rRNA (pseudouridine(1915)-N(3))-methyltransferase RlmH [Clostridiales Family XIII bacterium]
MNIQILCVGGLKERYWREAAAEYQKRLSKYCAITVEEVKESKTKDRPSQAEADAVKDAEGGALLRRVKKGAYLVALDVGGREFTSEGLAEMLALLPHSGKSQAAFLIGGSLGLSRQVLESADLRLSFSKMTFPHQMMRVILEEQLYRAFKINGNETYHK